MLSSRISWRGFGWAVASVVAAGALVSESALRGHATIRPESTLIDIGRRMQGQLIEQRFRFVNAGRENLTLGLNDKDCYCDRSFLSSEVVKPGAAGEVTIVVETAQMDGPVQKTITVSTNDPARRAVVFAVKAHIEPEFKFSDRFIDFGSVAAGVQQTQQMVIDILGDSKVRILSAVSTDDRVAVTLENHSSQDRPRATLAAVLTNDAPAGWVVSNIVLRTSSVFMPEIRVPVRGVVAERSPR